VDSGTAHRSSYRSFGSIATISSVECQLYDEVGVIGDHAAGRARLL
jgi:hypothetical protein